ncbi:ABC transporter ATP-binding protein [Tuberibacillus calidus]|jgi:sulfonate transport system ATP-binding protein|uniref:ABC transporter ATP-binding protein n=1 Tax=Tuberibacillus calidus TaxID=340097 RepID=UPI0003FE0577|nr:ATP-binding cassette domain-containing protein [Tuberibacillus calidus]
MVKTNTAHLQMSGIEKRFGSIKVLKGLDLTIHEGEFVAVVGKSGCGKSTLLRLIAGLDKPSSGTIFVAGEPLTTLNREARIVFQDGRLLPWKRVLDNVILGLGKSAKDEAMKVLEDVGLVERTEEWPGKLSGGQKQRVALARALMHKPKILLLDEPLGALDALTRMEMQKLMERLWLKHQFTTLLVTHDVEEAVLLADRVVLIKDGKIDSDVRVPLKRPRHKNQIGFGAIVEHILQQILEKKSEKTSASLGYV